MSFQDSISNQFSLFSVRNQECEHQDKVVVQADSKTSLAFSRKSYNRAYYLQNKQRLAEKKQRRKRKNILQLFSKAKVPAESASIRLPRIFKWVELIILITLSIVMTQYLVKESAGYYLEGNESEVSAYLKAAMVEGIAILFSFSRGRQRSLRVAQKAVMLLLCGLTLFTLSGRIIRSAVQDTSKFRTVTQTIKDLEAERDQKEQLRDKFMSREWIGATRKVDKDLSQVRKRLEELRHESMTVQAPDVVMSGLIILIAFRFLVVAANLICIHLIVEVLSVGSACKSS